MRRRPPSSPVPRRGSGAPAAAPSLSDGRRDRRGTASLRRACGGLGYPSRMDRRVIGVDLGGTKILAGIVDRDGSVERHRETATPVGSQAELLAALDDAVESLRDERVVALGFG